MERGITERGRVRESIAAVVGPSPTVVDKNPCHRPRVADTTTEFTAEAALVRYLTDAVVLAREPGGRAR